jgi:GNAT superfamily N-acetyltransferase
MEIEIRPTSILSDAATTLIAGLNAELSALYPEPGATHFRLDPDEVAAGRGAFLVAYADGAPVGCGAVRLLDEGDAELKRMFVVPPARGRGVGRVLLSALESEARALGARRLVLETGIRQTAALTLYRRASFADIPPYGEYAASPDTSVCLANDLARDLPPREAR